MDVYEAIGAGWERIRARVLSDPVDLARRMARGKSRNMTACPRAWCLVVRASDQRIDREYGWRPGQMARAGDHDVVLDTALVRMLVRPWWTGRPCSTKREVAEDLGVDVRTLDKAIAAGRWNVRKIQGLSGVRGPAVPVLYSAEGMDPGSGSHWRMQDVVWGTEFRWYNEWVPEGIWEKLTRTAIWRRGTKARGHEGTEGKSDEATERRSDEGGRHGGTEARRPGCAGKLEIRSTKSETRSGDPHPALPRSTGRGEDEASRSRPANGKGKDVGRVFRGYMWICPVCGRKVKKLYYPLPGYKRAELRGVEMPEAERPGFFACEKCHRVRQFSWTMPGAWNWVVSQLTGGLMYGSEVERPEGLLCGRKREFVAHPKARRARGKTRGKVMKLLLAGWRRREMAAKLRVSRSLIDQQIDYIYKEHGVHSREELERWQMENGRGQMAEGKRVLTSSVESQRAKGGTGRGKRIKFRAARNSQVGAGRGR